ncbi:MAG: hypothetical protein Q9227_007932 [Pyrenula ochraceoflavens]
MSSHRQSFSESLRGVPPSPRSQRPPSLSQIYLQELIDNPPARNAADPAFDGRDWRSIHISELTDDKDLVFVDGSMGIEAATNLLISSSAPVLLIRDPASPKSAISTFDYSDLNAYLLLVVGLVEPEEDQITSFQELAVKARSGTTIPLEDVKDLSRKEPLVKLPHTADLMKAIEKFGGGVHRIVVFQEGTDTVIGVLSQTRLVRFLWENGRSFPSIENLYHRNLRDLAIGSRDVISINGDQPLTDALSLMLNTGVSSLAVLDSSSNVIGNISVADPIELRTTDSFLTPFHQRSHFNPVTLLRFPLYLPTLTLTPPCRIITDASFSPTTRSRPKHQSLTLSKYLGRSPTFSHVTPTWGLPAKHPRLGAARGTNQRAPIRPGVLDRYLEFVRKGERLASWGSGSGSEGEKEE